MSDLEYLAGFNNQHESEALAGALPKGQFSPQQCPFGLYAEQFSSSAFTAPKTQNRRTWMYRITPSVVQGEVTEIEQPLLKTAPLSQAEYPHRALRWLPAVFDEMTNDFVTGLTTLCANGNPMSQKGSAIHLYHANRSMQEKYFYSADGELLIIPSRGAIMLHTELGRLNLSPREFAVIPRGIKFKVTLVDDMSLGYVCENYGHPLTLPERGPIGANGLANERDFQYPTASYEEFSGSFQLIGKFAGKLYQRELDHSPLDVVAWAGNSAPYKYLLDRFNTMGSISFDHPDPSIFTLLSSASDTPGTANLDLVVFPPRWSVAENTFRPPWFHRNMMSEVMGLIDGVYDAKQEGFLPGGISLHNAMTPHGPDLTAYQKAKTQRLEPMKIDNSLAFMLESRYPFMTTQYAMSSSTLDSDYEKCWQELPVEFDGK